MSFYAYQFFLVMALSLWVSCTRGWLSRLLRMLVFFTLVVPAALRYGIGYDYLPVYVERFDSVAFGGEPENWGAGFLTICRFLLYYNLDMQWLFAICSFVTCLSLFVFSRKGFHWCVLGFMATIYLSSYNAIRQELAVMFCILALVLSWRRRYLLSSAMIAVGCLFHTSVMLLLPLTALVVLLQKLSRKTILILISVAVPLIVVLRPFELFFSVASKIPALRHYMMFTQYEEYMGSGVGGTGLNFVLWMTVWMLHGTCLLHLYRSKRGKDVAIWCFVSLAFAVIGMQTRILARFQLITEVILPFSLMLFARRAHGNYRWFFYATVGLVLLSFFHDYGFNSNVNGPNAVIPYRSILD